jgi:transposase InsO family protein
MPRIGGKKLYHILKEELSEVGKIGRDKFFRILREQELLVPIKRSYTKTTNSHHRFHKHKNLLKESTLSRGNACWVADITYLRTENGFRYLFLLTDAFSRKIVGYDLSGSLSIEGGLKALEMALKQRDGNNSLIHHSDRGIQYCSYAYTDLLRNNDILISMTEENHCYENAIAERVNGILKGEFLLDITFKDKEQCLKAVEDSIRIYNDQRPHFAIGLKTPTEKHNEYIA